MLMVFFQREKFLNALSTIFYKCVVNRPIQSEVKLLAIRTLLQQNDEKKITSQSIDH